MDIRSPWRFVSLCLVFAMVAFCSARCADQYPKAEGYQGIWYANEPTKDEYVFKYSGGLGTCGMKHIPMALHAPKAAKTFEGDWASPESRTGK